MPNGKQAVFKTMEIKSICRTPSFFNKSTIFHLLCKVLPNHKKKRQPVYVDVYRY